MVTIASINTKLQNLNIISGFNEVASKANELASTVQALNSSSLGGLLNENISGVQALNTAASALTTVALLTENLTGLQDQIVGDVSGSKTQLDAITGTSVDNGFNDFVFTSATAEGVKAAINLIASPSQDQLNTILTNIVPEQFSGQVSALALNSFGSFVTDFSSTVQSFSSSFNNLLSVSTGSILQDIILQVNAAPLNIIESLGVPSDRTSEIFNLLTTNNLAAAAEIVSKISGISIAEAEAGLARVPTNIADQIEGRRTLPSSVPVHDVSSINNRWDGASTPDTYFEIVATFEHLVIEMIKSPREITEVVFFGHETTENQIVTASELHETYNAVGINGIPFHYVILPNGNLQRGRPLSQDGEYIEAHNKYSIGVVIPHVKDRPMTVHQGRTIDQLLEAFWQVWPGGQAFDAQKDIGYSTVWTGFNIESYLAKYRKVNHGSADRSYSTQQLIAAAQGNL